MTQSPTSWTSTGLKAKPILADNTTLVNQMASRMFEKSYAQLEFPSGSGYMYTMPGLVVALNSSTNKYVPWVADASHGAGSDTAVGILIEQLELTEWDRMCSPMNHGVVIEAHIYTEAGALGTVPAAIKTDLPDIFWR